MFSIVHWPLAPFTGSLCQNALESLNIKRILPSNLKEYLENNSKCFIWASYDDIDHELVHNHPDLILVSSYTIRKALIRKHFLAKIIQMRCTKYPDSILHSTVPKTFEFHIAFADELDELFADDLWELGVSLSEASSWWILKPGMADRGNGLRLFNSREQLEAIFEQFEEDESLESPQDETNVITSQLRHFVVQEYIPNPLLMNPKESVPLLGDIEGRKFHLRVYAIASGTISVYFLRHILSLFSAVPYEKPSNSTGEVNLGPHLTNTALQTSHGEENVRLLDELIGQSVSGIDSESTDILTKDDVQSIITQIRCVLDETFLAALEFPTHFQAMPNAFELFGVDFILSYQPKSDGSRFCVHLLEFNAEPAIELTGSRLSWILQDLFNAMAILHVEPFSTGAPSFRRDDWTVGEEKHNLVKCCDIDMRR